jgi:MFS family permease
MIGGEREARRTAYILAASQAIIGSAAPIALSIGGLAGFYLLDTDKSLATAPVTGFSVGMALGALPAAAIIRGLGQRSGFMFGTAVTAAGGAIATLALFRSEFWLFAFGLLVIGIGNAFVQQFRFAAADNAPPEFKANAISFVLAGGIITAILGPQIVIFTRELFAPIMFAGSFAAIIGLSAVGAVILAFLRVKASGGTVAAVDQSDARPLMEIVTQPRFAAALICGVGTYTLMSFVMTGAPLAMVGCGFSPDEATLGISWHVMAMAQVVVSSKIDTEGGVLGNIILRWRSMPTASRRRTDRSSAHARRAQGDHGRRNRHLSGIYRQRRLLLQQAEDAAWKNAASKATTWSRSSTTTPTRSSG